MVSGTIAAIATAVNNSGINIIRISGEDAVDIAYKIFTPNKKDKDIRNVPSHTVHYGFIKDNDEIVDEVMLIIMRAPNTYTREDVVEIDCHGGVIVTKKILEIVINAGASPAMPGEFTKRAFLNGRIDLSQAEAVMDIINSKSELALKSSLRQLKGNIKDKISHLRQIIIEDVAYIEAALDDPEYMSIDDYKDTLCNNVKYCFKEIGKLIDSYDNGKNIKEGIDTVIVGKPNAGKSSFLNAVIGHERAIVTDIEGTTRDIIKEEVNINGIVLNIIDTAGIRDTKDVIEKMGIDKAIEYLENSDLVIYIADSSKNLDDNDYSIIDKIKDKKAIILLNKTDLEQKISVYDLNKLTDKKVISISAKNSEGLDEVYETLKKMFFNGNIDFNDEVIITNARQKEALVNAKDSLNNVIESIENDMPEDFYSIDMMGAYEALGLVNGQSLEDDLADTIFEKFCMGK